MTRVKRGIISRKHRHNLLARTKGFTMTNRRLVKRASEADLHAGQYAFAGRKQRKREMRKLWILRISEAVKGMGWSYREFIHALLEKKVVLNRKILANLSAHHPEIFEKIVAEVKK
ncbi:50S ribosomal protein L20 [Candidatus Roizmanbacteria bacterium]|nr:50S ribosomal protein L20 [Candidatus Roizmanbacteria bacterium]